MTLQKQLENLKVYYQHGVTGPLHLEKEEMEAVVGFIEGFLQEEINKLK